VLYISIMSRKNEWKKRSGVVYSTNPGHDYRTHGAQASTTLPPEKQHLRVLIDRKHRKGKEVTIVKGFIGSASDGEALCRKIKVYCGAGGSFKDGEIIIQGDQRRKVLEFLSHGGYNVKG